MKKFYLIPFVYLTILTSCTSTSNFVEFETSWLQLGLDKKGNVVSLCDLENKKDYACGKPASPLLSIRINNQVIKPSSAEWNSSDKTIFLQFDPGSIQAKVKVIEKETHLTFELVSVDHADSIELVVWGPFQTTINKIVGETVGVVRGEEFALGLQALNPKTLGGYPWQENDCMPQIDIFENGNFNDLSEKGKRHVLYRVEAAKPTDFGSSLQAYCRNRNRERVISNWGHGYYPAPPYHDGGITGSKISLFGCPVKKTLETLGNIELSENLPHPLLNGQWSKTATEATAAYLIYPFGEEDIDQAIKVTKQAGLKYLYHPDPFKTWGHFMLNDQFPNGIRGLKACVERAEQESLFVGVHTLSNFITTNDAYITPMPDPRLAKAGRSLTTEDISLEQNEIPLEAPEVFQELKNNNLKTIQIGDELIRYSEVSDTPPWKLLNCKRGAWGTVKTTHSKGEKIELLADHGYKVFLTDADLSIEVAANIADLFNRTGLRQISFDGLEGNRSTGMGNYGEILFTNEWYQQLSPNIREHYIADASRTSHYFWHIYTRMNWGEPWYAGFRESQTEYRLKNQAYFTRNMMPHMLGWFSLRDTTSSEDIEWMLARAAGFDAGFAFVVNPRTLQINGRSEKILDLVKTWETARMKGAFTEDQKTRLQDIHNEFHLEPADGQSWDLYPVHASLNNKYLNKSRQPGEPTVSSYDYTNPYKEQILAYTIKMINTDQDDSISNMYIELDGIQRVTMSITLTAGQILKVDRTGRAVLYDEFWNKIEELSLPDLKISNGDHTIEFNGKFFGSEKAEVHIEFRCTGDPEHIQGGK